MSMNDGTSARSKVRLIIAAIGVLIGLFVACGTDMQPGHPTVSRMAGVAIIMAALWLTEVVPLAATALLPLVLLPLLGIASGESVAREYSQDVIFVFLGGFLMALAMERWGLHQRIALFIISRFGASPRRLIFGFLLATAILSMWISNTAAAMIMVTIALAVIQTAEKNQERQVAQKTALAILLAVAYAATIGGVATPVGTPPNLVFIQIFRAQYPEGPSISFLRWMLFAVPISGLLLASVWLVLAYGVLPRRIESFLPKDMLRDQFRALGKTRFPEWVVMMAFACLVVLWITRSAIDLGGFTLFGWSRWFGNPDWITDGTVSIGIALSLFFIPARQGDGSMVMDWETATRLPWGIVLLFGGGFALATGVARSGLSDWLGGQLQGLDQLPLIVVLLVICLGICFASEFTSNTATTQLVLPILVALAAQMKVNPLMILLPATIACSWGFMLPVGTPPNAIVFGTNRVRMIEMASVGIVVNLIAVAVVVLAIFAWGRSIWGIDSMASPPWAH